MIRFEKINELNKIILELNDDELEYFVNRLFKTE